jgi:hypothetical protein
MPFGLSLERAPPCYLMGNKVTGALARSPTNGSASGITGTVHPVSVGQTTFGRPAPEIHGDFRLSESSNPCILIVANMVSV